MEVIWSNMATKHLESILEYISVPLKSGRS